jgi:hypothetical protein
LYFADRSVDPQTVALKLFTGIEKFEIMAIPFFILAGNFLTHGGVARRMINFATSMVGHWYGGIGLAGVMACALFAAVSGSSPATVVAIGSIMLPAMVKQGYPPQFGAGVVDNVGRARHPDPALDRHGDVCGGDRRHRRAGAGRQECRLGVGRPAVHRRRHPRPDAGHDAGPHHLVARQEEQLSAHAQGAVVACASRRSARASGGSP